MRTVFIGGTKRGFLTLQGLIETGANIVGIISLRQDAHEVERYESQMQALGNEHDIPVFETKFMKERDYAELLKSELKADLALAIGVRILLPEAVYTAPLQGTLAVHDSLIPEYRGFAPLNWAIINGEKKTGVTLFYLSDEMDGGDIVDQIEIPIGNDETAPQIYELVCDATIAVVTRNYKKLAENTAPRKVQNYDEGSFTCSRLPGDGMIDWNNSTTKIYNLIRGLAHPYPGAFTFHNNQKLFIWSAKPVEKEKVFAGRIPGRIVAFSKDSGFVDVLTGDGILRLTEVQVEGCEKARAADVLNSVKVKLGLDLFELWQRMR